MLAPGGVVVTTTTTSPFSSARCVGVPSVVNAFVSNATLINFGNNSFQGQVQFTCKNGYSFTTTAARRWVSCNNGVWDPLPVCSGISFVSTDSTLMTHRSCSRLVSAVCSFSQLQSSLASLMIVSQGLSAWNGGLLPGGWIMFRCRPGLTLNPFSGQFNVTCQETGWAPFPVCT